VGPNSEAAGESMIGSAPDAIETPSRYWERITVVVLNWNRRDDTLACLESLRAVEYPNWEVLVVDNGSEDDSVEAIRKSYPEVSVIETGSNLGYAGGNNLGIRAALERGADYVLVLNNDTIVASDLLLAFAQTAREHPDAAALGAKIYLFEDPQRLWYAGTRWKVMGADFEHIGNRMLDDGENFVRVCETEYACGCAMLLRASAVRAVGLLDEKFFLLFEETDWCFRAKAAGFRCLFAPAAKVWHRVSSSFGGRTSVLYEYFLFRNRLLWAERHLGVRRRVAVWMNMLGILFPLLGVIGPLWHLLCGRSAPRQAFWQSRSEAVQWLRRLREPSSTRMWVRRARWRGVRDYLARRFGDCPPWVRAVAARDTSRPGSVGA
jgi:GT2 family glycosyltransferase